MRQRLSTLLRDLLPEQHVYVRSGPRSRYVVLTWPWQVGVSVALAAVAAWAGLATVGWLAAHLETLDQSRELARVAEVNQQLEALVAAYDPEQASPSPDVVRSVLPELEQVKARGHIGLPDAAAAELPDLRSEASAGGWLAEWLVPAAMQVDDSGSGRAWLYDRIARDRIDDQTRTAETIRLRAELRAARAEVARLQNALRRHAERR